MYYESNNMKTTFTFTKKVLIAVILIITLFSSFDVVKLNRMLLDGSMSKVFHEGEDSATIECFWDRTSPDNYRIKINTTLTGKRFDINPDSLNIVSSSPEVDIYSSTSVGVPVTSHKFYTLFGKTQRYISQSIEMVYRSSVDNDSVFLCILPSNYILYDGRTVVKDTIKLSFNAHK